MDVTRSGDATGSSGFTLIELVVVVVLVAALATLVIPTVASVGDESHEVVTRANMARVREAILERYLGDMRHAEDPSLGAPAGHGSGLPWPAAGGGRADHPQLHVLYHAPRADAEYDPIHRLGWRGPYLEPATSVSWAPELAPAGEAAFYGEPGDRAPADGWGRPLVIQLPDVTPGAVTEEELLHVRLVSAGANGELEVERTSLTCPEAERGDDLVAFLLIAEPEP